MFMVCRITLDDKSRHSLSMSCSCLVFVLVGRGRARETSTSHEAMRGLCERAAPFPVRPEASRSEEPKGNARS